MWRTIEELEGGKGYSFILLCLTTRPWPLPNRVPHTVPYIATSFNFVVSLRSSQELLMSSSSSSHHLYLPFSNVIWKAAPLQDLTNPVSLPSFYGLYDVLFLLNPW
jgi:hypothetical protein